MLLRPLQGVGEGAAGCFVARFRGPRAPGGLPAAGPATEIEDEPSEGESGRESLLSAFETAYGHFRHAGNDWPDRSGASARCIQGDAEHGPGSLHHRTGDQGEDAGIDRVLYGLHPGRFVYRADRSGHQRSEGSAEGEARRGSEGLRDCGFVFLVHAGREGGLQVSAGGGDSPRRVQSLPASSGGGVSGDDSAGSPQVLGGGWQGPLSGRRQHFRGEPSGAGGGGQYRLHGGSRVGGSG